MLWATQLCQKMLIDSTPTGVILIDLLPNFGVILIDSTPTEQETIPYRYSAVRRFHTYRRRFHIVIQLFVVKRLF